jgi:hypothetical protein
MEMATHDLLLVAAPCSPPPGQRPDTKLPIGIGLARTLKWILRTRRKVARSARGRMCIYIYIGMYLVTITACAVACSLVALAREFSLESGPIMCMLPRFYRCAQSGQEQGMCKHTHFAISIVPGDQSARSNKDIRLADI